MWELGMKFSLFLIKEVEGQGTFQKSPEPIAAKQLEGNMEWNGAWVMKSWDAFMPLYY